MQMLSKYLLVTLLSTLSATLAAAPFGYSINSDSPNDDHDSLYRIDLGTGAETLIGPVTSFGEGRLDVEGLAFAPDGTLYGIDEFLLPVLFPLNPDNGQVQTADEVYLDNLPSGGGNDFGMTFACDGALYVTSVSTGSLYNVKLTGETTRIGALDSLGADISALAAYGEPAKLYGLGNGQEQLSNDNFVTATPSLFEIDLATGIATEIGPLGAAVGDYLEAGLAFDDEGQLWAITDRQFLGQPSQVFKVDLSTGTASDVRDLTEIGYESLAITVPRGCAGNGGDNAQFKVQKQFLDGNTELATTLNIRCDGGLPLEQSVTTLPGTSVEVTFTVTEFEDGALNCEIWESTEPGYNASYECFSTGTCAATASACTFSSVNRDQDNLCVVRNVPESVEVEVIPVWEYLNSEMMFGDQVTVDLLCRNIVNGDGLPSPEGMVWSWVFSNNYSESQQSAIPDSGVATIQPRPDGSSECRTESRASSSAVESTSNCDSWQPVVNGGTLVCTVTNTAFFEGIPTLNRTGLVLASLLVLLTGLIFVRRF